MIVPVRGGGTMPRRILAIALATILVLALVALLRGLREDRPVTPESGTRTPPSRAPALPPSPAPAETTGSTRQEDRAEEGEPPLGPSSSASAPPTLSIRGIVVRASGAPASGHDIIAGPLNPDRIAHATVSAADGGFRLSRVRPGADEILVGPPRSGFWVRFPLPGRPRPDDLDLGRLELPGLLSIRGRVVDEDGRAVPRADVFVNADTATVVGFVNRTADGDGRFEVGGLPPGRYDVSAQPGWASLDALRGETRNVRSGDDGEVLIRLTRAMSLLLLFEAADAPGEALGVEQLRVEVDGEVRATNLSGSRIRLYPGPGTHRVTIRTARYRLAIVEHVRVSPDGETVVTVPLERAG
jgi:hypothetical protein